MQSKKNILVTGGCGFIGSHFASLVKQHFNNVVVVDSLTYAAVNTPERFKTSSFICDYGVYYYRCDINNQQFIKHILENEQIEIVVNFAAESHVDNSITSASKFIDTNVQGVLSLINACREAWSNKGDECRFIQVSTDEVYGSLLANQKSFNESSNYNPRNPYAASKAAADHLVDSFVNTFQFPAIVTHCCNNYGPGQHLEKFIPKCIQNIYYHKKIPIYGDGKNIREWIHVIDHCNGILHAIQRGKVGEHYNFGTGFELTNLELTEKICAAALANCKQVVTFVPDRLGHDLRYSIDSSKARRELHWEPVIQFDQGLGDTIRNYMSRWKQQTKDTKSEF